MLLLLLQVVLPATVHAVELADSPELRAGIQAYREGRFLDAEKRFRSLHAQSPEDVTATYYLAITQAQLGRFAQAKALYEEILAKSPDSEAGRLAKEGLAGLPPETFLDRPPRFQQPQVLNADAKTKTPDAQAEAAVQPPAVSPQDMMLWQMMMAQMGGAQGKGGMAMPWMYMMPGMSGDGTTPPIDPAVMSNLLMNQMMQNFSLDGGKLND